MSAQKNWPDRLHDARSKQVVFLSHCLLNENTRYLGGARKPGVVREIVEPLLAQGVGLVQMPCPEQHAWGGVNKRYLLGFYGAQGTLRFRLREILLPLMLAYPRRVYRRLAKQVARQMEDYIQQGYTIRGIVGVDGSPSCGVFQAMNLQRALDQVGSLDKVRATDQDMNAIVRRTIMPGRGLFVECLKEEMRRRGIDVPFMAHNLIDELDGAIKPLVLP